MTGYAISARESDAGTIEFLGSVLAGPVVGVDLLDFIEVTCKADATLFEVFRFVAEFVKLAVD